MRDAILIVGGGLLQIPAVRIAQELGFVVVMTDASLHAPAMQQADEPIALDIFDVEGHRQLVEELMIRYHLRGVFTEGADVEVTVAAAAAVANVPGIPVDAALNTKSKQRMRQCFDQAGILNPAWKEVHSINDGRIAAQTIGFPIMVKAVDNCGSRGTTRVEYENQLDDAIRWAQDQSTTHTALLEECFQGPEQSVEILFESATSCHRLNIVDRPFQKEGAYAIELGHVNPTQLDAHKQEQLFDLTEQAAAACGVQFGVFKADTIWTSTGPRILEVTARLSGGFDSQYTTPLSTGRNFIRAAMRLAVGLPLDSGDLQSQWSRYAAAWSSFPSPGMVDRIEEIDEVRKLPGVKEIFLRVQEGDVIEPYTTCVARPAFVIAVGDTYEEAVANAQRGVQALRIETSPLVSV